MLFCTDLLLDVIQNLSFVISYYVFIFIITGPHCDAVELTRSFFQGEDFGLGSDINPGHLTNGVLLELSNEFAGNLYDTVSILWPHLFTPQQLKRTVGKVRTTYTKLHKNSHRNNKSVLFLQDRLFSEADVTEAIAQVTKKTVKENKVFVQQEKVIKELGKNAKRLRKTILN